MEQNIKFEDLENADLIVDCTYQSKRTTINNISVEPLNKLMRCGNQGGFRYRGSTKTLKFEFLILTSSLNEIDWPDYIDEENGTFIYYGDNRKPGYELHNTRKKGNLILKNIFDNLHSGKREKTPPIFIFTTGKRERDVIFRGLAVPGTQGLNQTEDLVAIWKSNESKRFQNYKATFTILDIPLVKREWINDLIKGDTLSKNCPRAWRNWRLKGLYAPLIASKTKKYRTVSEQIPEAKYEKELINTIYQYFRKNPFDFEKCACELARLMDKNITRIDVTRPTKDGGFDGLGKYKLGLEDNSVEVDFALEAKLFKMSSSVGVKHISRLISRLRFRQFGIFVTTSYIATQAYNEIIEDNHPVILICAKDIVKILRNVGIDTKEKLQSWLTEKFPLSE